MKPTVEQARKNLADKLGVDMTKIRTGHEKPFQDSGLAKAGLICVSMDEYRGLKGRLKGYEKGIKRLKEHIDQINADWRRDWQKGLDNEELKKKLAESNLYRLDYQKHCHRLEGEVRNLKLTIKKLESAKQAFNDVIIHTLAVQDDFTPTRIFQEICARMGYFFTAEQAEASRTTEAKQAFRKEIPAKELELP